jgi:hypothetical protein
MVKRLIERRREERGSNDTKNMTHTEDARDEGRGTLKDLYSIDLSPVRHVQQGDGWWWTDGQGISGTQA